MTGASSHPLVGVLGGSFDPPHLGHVRMARRAREALGLERILLMPAGRPPHKQNGLTAEHHRVAMVRAAIEDEPGLELCEIELDGSTSYTYRTLCRMREDPTFGTPLFILGGDSVRELPSWYASDRLTREFDLIAVDRPGSGIEGIRSGLGAGIASRVVPLSPLPPAAGTRGPAPGAGGRIFRLPMEPIDVSASSVRERVASGGDPGRLVPPSVARYIQREGIYRREATN